VALFGKREDEMTEAGPANPLVTRQKTSAPAYARNTSRSERTSDVANIGKSITIKGDLKGNEDLSIEGKVEGKVELPNNQLTIGANGVVKAEINAKAIIVIGHVSGNINGTERVEIQATGVVDGDVTSPRLVVAEGAVLNGAIHMGQQPGASTGNPPAAPGAAIRKTA
jgi:cytoskeletal protein CcmA (bactofilin family)